MTDINYDIKQIPLTDIHADSDFNCRLDLAPIDVRDLAMDIEQRGLIQPVTVRPYSEEEQQATGKQYLLIAGYRRHMAFRVLEKKAIPAIIMDGAMKMEDALLMNLAENVQRKELNIMEEAHALAKVKALRMNEFDVADKIGKSRGWVQVRFMLLDLPIEVQKEVVVFKLSHANIRELRAIWKSTDEDEDKDELYDAVKKLKDAKSKGQKNITVQPKGRDNKRIRKKLEIQRMNDEIYDAVGAGLVTRALAWASGELSDQEFFAYLKEEAEKQGKVYYPPDSFDSFS